MSGEFVMDMLVPERLFYIRKLTDEIREYNERQQEAIRKAKMKSPRRR